MTPSKPEAHPLLRAYFADVLGGDCYGAHFLAVSFHKALSSEAREFMDRHPEAREQTPPFKLKNGENR
ncbi:hypothetical protein [Kocuria sp. SM24M-10]|uniref:hypothetical protein n=1 Tax=Kocuria sp. SM24M-10 TaxID=1660349 RepID=UPI000649A9D2|nr:hypothetical protein [Kocuria sp. SM24M-10]KLU10011.1 hypothetical protein ABL57_09120 [Kocuria sp. SM24M-10]